MNKPSNLMMNQAVDSLLDRAPNPCVGEELSRVEGPLKVSGTATYAAEYKFDEDVLHGFLVSASIAKGTVQSIDEHSATAIDGVVAVVTDFKAFLRNSQQGGEKKAPTQGVKEVEYFGQPIALVVAKTFEAAREGAAALKVTYQEQQGAFDFIAELGKREPITSGNDKPEHKNNPDEGLANADVKVDSIYVTPSQNSAAMEPHATIAEWKGDKLTLHCSMQMLSTCKQQICDALDLKADNVRLISRYVGGGFGSKLGISPESIAAAIAAKQLQRPVKVVMHRIQVFESTVRRTNTRQRVALGADRDGRIHTIIHNTICSNLPKETFFEPTAVATHFSYSGQNREVKYEMVRMNQVLAGSMRAPGEAVGMLALECAMDELAVKLDMDPVELRKLNEPVIDPSKEIPFSTRKLSDTLDYGATHFGWDKRHKQPASQRDGDWLIGMGMASAMRSNMLKPSVARVTLTSNARAIVETDMTDIGTGTYTVLTQIAADLLGLPVSQVEVRLGDTDFPPAAGSGGSVGACSSGSSVYVACKKIRETLAKELGVEADNLTLHDGQASGNGISKPIQELIEDDIVTLGMIEPGKTSMDYTQASFGAHFAEVAVNAITGETRIRRMLGVFTAGRILNEKTARSQCYGGMVFGIGAALMEELLHDPHNGRLLNHDLAEYHVPVNADVPPIDVVFLPERDPYANPLHAKGLGELGISGAGAAIANAIYNATGIRLYEYPLTLDKLLDQLPAV